MINKKLVLSALAVASVCGSASAATFSDTDVYGIAYLAQGHSLSGTFQLDVDDDDSIPDNTGFVPGTHFATSAELSFLLSDDFVGGFGADALDAGSSWDEGVTINLGAYNLATNFEIDLLTVVGETTANLTLLGDINSDGQLNYTLIAADGDLMVMGGKLEVTAEERAPDAGSSAGLLALGLLGLGALKRKK